MRLTGARPRTGTVKRRTPRGRIAHRTGRNHMSGSKDERAVPSAARADTAGSVVAFPSRQRPGAPRRAIDAAARERIGRGLRLHYADVLSLPVPDRLLTLLDALADTEAQP
jgi:hypothetical protein